MAYTWNLHVHYIFVRSFLVASFSSVKTSVSWNKDRPQWLVGKDWIATLAERNRSLGRGQLCVCDAWAMGLGGFWISPVRLEIHGIFLSTCFCEFFQGDNIAANPCLNPVWEGWNKHLVWRMIVETPIFVWRVRCLLTTWQVTWWVGSSMCDPFNFESCFFFPWSPTIDQQVTPESPTKNIRLLEDWLQIFNHFLGGENHSPKTAFFTLRVDVSMGIYVYTTRMDGIYFKEIEWKNLSVILFPKNTYGEISLKYFLLRCPTFYKSSPFQLIVEKVAVTDVLVDDMFDDLSLAPWHTGNSRRFVVVSAIKPPKHFVFRRLYSGRFLVV